MSEDESSSGTGTRRRHRTRHLLSSYYGVDDDGSSSSSSSTFDINSPQFDKSGFIENLLKRRHVEDLVAESNRIVSEMKSLDGDLQSLVYENYNKFISATDTIKTMKTNVEDMEEEMSRLSENMDEICKASESVNGSLGERRNKIEQLTSVHRILKKMQFLLELPQRLKECTEMKAYSQAVNYFNIASKILVQYSHLASFQQIQNESKDTMAEMTRVLWDGIEDQQSSLSTLQENTSLLIELGVDVKEIRSRFISVRKVWLSEILDDWEIRKGEALPTCIQRINARFIPMFLDTARFFITVFKQMAPSRINDKFHQTKEESESWKDLVLCTRELFHLYFRATRSVMLLRSDQIPNDGVATVQEIFAENSGSKAFLGDARVIVDMLFPVDDFVVALELLAGDVERVSEVVPEAHLEEHVANNLSDIVKALIIRQLSGLKSSFDDCLNELLSDQINNSGAKRKSVNIVAKESVEKLVSRTRGVISKLQPLVLGNRAILSGHRRVMLQLIGSEMSFLVSHMKTSIMAKENSRAFANEVTAGRTADSLSQRGALSLCAFCRLMNSNAIPEMNNSLEPFRKEIEREQRYGTGSPVLALHTAALSISSMAGEFELLAKKFLCLYVEIIGASLSSMVRKGMDSPNWKAMKEARDVRLMIDLLVKQLHATDVAVSSVVGSTDSNFDSTRDEDVGAATSASSASRQAWQKMKNIDPFQRKIDLDVDKVFSKALGTFRIREPDFDSGSVMHEIIKLVLKTFLESVRLHTFGVNGFQQLQVDCAYLRWQCCSLISDSDSLLNRMMDQIARSSRERSFEPIPLEQGVIDAILEAKQIV